MTCSDQRFSKVIHELEVVAGVITIVFIAVFPVESQPADHVDDGVDVFVFFFFGVGVIKAQMTGTWIVAGEFEVEADAFGMSNMQIAIGLGGKTCAYACTVYPTLLLYGCRPRFARPALFSV